jgi:hypothetical protein
MSDSVSEARKILQNQDPRGLKFFENALTEAESVSTSTDDEVYIVTVYGEDEKLYQNSGPIL